MRVHTKYLLAAAITALTCNPLIDSRWVRPESRIAASSLSAIPPRSPLAKAAAIAPGEPGTAERT